MSNEKLFTAIYIPETPFVNGVLKPKKAKKYNFELFTNKKIADTLYHFIYKKNDKQIHSFYLIGDLEDELERYLFVENNELYDEFVSQFWGGGERYWVSGMDTYLDVCKPEDALIELNKAYSNSFYEEDEPMPMCHIFGQQMWHDNAYLIANRTALIELRKAIDTALKFEETRLGLSPSDGEGYDLFIKCVEDNFKWEALEMPYHDRECYVPDETVNLSPYKAFKKYKI
ncbi:MULTISPECIES: hypothetical protein [unclassified Bacillus (in: firmicutes)]|uniref:hypothetical protein n=1 Tax=unclassified Bacillus (in: firmicutes) TaxID=185979 RepID=UPI001BEBBB76|nr:MULTISPECIES: hypothetical protein [unclassified Bacillus (in: firmicutes)]MBT2617361.1 hypothetical protein [Bacillus sp. ISL-78]MBT2630947.1 hypothetical protein [Bacillus sp. ISL-101]